jgi:hypothetical protein
MVGRCYTKARRLPLVVGELSGFRLWGGPYSVTQLVTMVVVLGVMLLLHPLWAHYGLLNAALLVGVPFAVSFVVRYLPAEGRNPLMALGGATGVLVAPGQGRIAGRPLRRRYRPVPVSGACTITWQPVMAAHPPAVAPSAPVREARAADPANGARARRSPVREADEMAPSLPPDGTAPVRVLSGVGALLASRDRTRSATGGGPAPFRER